MLRVIISFSINTQTIHELIAFFPFKFHFFAILPLSYIINTICSKCMCHYYPDIIHCYSFIWNLLLNNRFYWVRCITIVKLLSFRCFVFFFLASYFNRFLSIFLSCVDFWLGFVFIVICFDSFPRRKKSNNSSSNNNEEKKNCNKI